ncbi:uncharacterized protein LOC143729397 isoform X2 [Siphateles boraxobius]|uniref:uncharacterized protein LOC143729397 isoform X2 n=1 Tax=Siphateles boraxobius TaxID=180520 RepID=UPI0040630D23
MQGLLRQRKQGTPGLTYHAPKPVVFGKSISERRKVDFSQRFMHRWVLIQHVFNSIGSTWLPRNELGEVTHLTAKVSKRKKKQESRIWLA